MAFEVFEPGAGRSQRTPEGRWRLDKSGQATLAAADLATSGIRFDAIALVCPQTKRVALRAPRDGEVRTFRLGRGAKGTEAAQLARNGTIQLRKAWATIGVDCAKRNGQYVLARKDDLLILELTSEADAERIAGNRGSAKR